MKRATHRRSDHRRRRDERGVAIVVAIIVSFVVVLLGTAAVVESSNSINQSAGAGSQVVSVDAAEAGLHYEVAELTDATSQSSLPSTFTCPSGSTAVTTSEIKSLGRGGLDQQVVEAAKVIPLKHTGPTTPTTAAPTTTTTVKPTTTTTAAPTTTTTVKPTTTTTAAPTTTTTVKPTTTTTAAPTTTTTVSPTTTTSPAGGFSGQTGSFQLYYSMASGQPPSTSPPPTTLGAGNGTWSALTACSGTVPLDTGESYAFVSTGSSTAINESGEATTASELVYVAAGSGSLNEGIFGNQGLVIQNTLTVAGASGTTGGVYSNGPYTCQNQSTTGEITVFGTLTIQNNCVASGNVFASGDVSLYGSGVQVKGTTESQASISVYNSTNNKSGAAYSLSQDNCSEAFSSCNLLTNPNAPTFPAQQTFPSIPEPTTAWSGWNLVTEGSCSISSLYYSQPTILELPSTCSLNLASQGSESYELDDSVAVFAPGGISASQNVTFGSSGGSPTPDLDLIVPSSYESNNQSVTTSCTGGSAPGFTFSVPPTFNSPSPLDVLMYTPCNMDLANGWTSTMDGQIYAGGTLTVDGSGINVDYPGGNGISVPGATGGAASGAAVTQEWVRRIATP